MFLVNSGYGVVRVGDDVRLPALAMDAAMRAFSHQNEEEKVRYVTISGDRTAPGGGDNGSSKEEKQRHSPNEFHGFARVEGLKEQFMVGFATLVHDSNS